MAKNLLALTILMPLGAAAQPYHTVYAFAGGADGGSPHAGVTLRNGILFGTTYTGGYGEGTVFALAPAGSGSWVHYVLHRFTNNPDGALPAANLVFDSAGVLFGTTLSGGTGGGGTVFALALPATSGGMAREGVLYSLPGGCGVRNPYGAVLIGPSGMLYTTTAFN
jgi:uncharacterized repeat protein (TIGR03803 family)